MGVLTSIEGSNPSFSAWRGGRAVECGGLENRFGPLGPTRVQIPPPPPFCVRNRVTKRFLTISVVRTGYDRSLIRRRCEARLIGPRRHVEAVAGRRSRRAGSNVVRKAPR